MDEADGLGQHEHRDRERREGAEQRTQRCLAQTHIQTLPELSRGLQLLV